MNVDLLRRIQAHNTAHPEQLDMHVGLMIDCNSVGCIAGHACLLGGMRICADDPFEGEANWDSISWNARNFLKITPDQAELLFDTELVGLSLFSPGTPEYAAIVNARIDRFIETGGAE